MRFAVLLTRTVQQEFWMEVESLCEVTAAYDAITTEQQVILDWKTVDVKGSVQALEINSME